MTHDFRHEALFYADEDEFLAGTVPFLRDGLWAAEPLLVAVGEGKTAALKRELGDDADAIEFVDMEALGRNPARIIPAWERFVAGRETKGRPVRGIGEPIWPGRSEAEVVECHHHEALLNLAFADTPAFWLLCPYDTTGLDAAVVAQAQCTHPIVSQGSASRPSDRYISERVPSPFEGELPPPASAPQKLAFGRDQLSRARSFVAELARVAGLSADRTSDLVLAVSEVATNSVCHGGGGGTLRVWTDDQSLYCEIRDDGAFAAGPLAGRVRPAPAQMNGRGLWLVNHLCDLVQIRTGPHGNVVRMHMALIRP